MLTDEDGCARTALVGALLTTLSPPWPKRHTFKLLVSCRPCPLSHLYHTCSTHIAAA